MSAALDGFVAAMAGQRPANRNLCAGLCGRLIRGKKPEDFLSLTDDPTRQIVMLVDETGLADMPGKTGYEMLIHIGYTPDHLAHKVQEGNEFKLVVFPQTGAALGDWDNMIRLIGEVYPKIYTRLVHWLPALRAIPFAEIQAQAGYSFLEVEKAGAGDDRFMTYERYLLAPDTLVSTRAFLYFTIHLRDLYSGDGYTYDQNGNRGCAEYIIRNLPLAELGEHRIIDIPVQLLGGSVMNNASAAGQPAAFPILPFPDVFDPKKVGTIFSVDYEAVAQAAIKWADKHQIKPAATDSQRILLLGIDMQITFGDKQGELYVAGASGDGAVDDGRRFAEFLYRNLPSITTVAMTMDTHRAIQIFHAAAWQEVGNKRNHPAPFTMIVEDEHQQGQLISIDPATQQKTVWEMSDAMRARMSVSPATLKRFALHYVRTLKKAAKHSLTIWPYHAMLGGLGHALVPIVHEAAFFHGIARGSETHFETKGGNPLTEHYSVLAPEVTTQPNGSQIDNAQRNANFYNMLMDYDKIIIGGEAASHCVAWTIYDLKEQILAQDAELCGKVYILRDCTSPVVLPGIDFTPVAEKALQEFRAAGMHVVESTTPMEKWPNMQVAQN